MTIHHTKFRLLQLIKPGTEYISRVLYEIEESSTYLQY
jgi:hypothetical protein